MFCVLVYLVVWFLNYMRIFRHIYMYQDLASVADRFSAARDDAISTLAAALRPKLRSAVTELLGGESATDRFVMTESSYATAESLREEGGDWATALLDKVSFY
jgi:hypothetical protein